MGEFIFGMVCDIALGTTRKRLAVAEALESRPRNRAGARIRGIALWLFLISAFLILMAAISHSVAGMPFLGELLGWSGIVGLELCVVCGARYAIVNRSKSPRA